jgi:hypothetical protein
MDTIPVEEVNRKMQVRYTMPEVIRNRDKTVKRKVSGGTPVYRRSKSERFDEDFYPLAVKKKFFRDHVFGKHPLPPATLKVFFHLCSGLDYSHIKIAHDGNGEPVTVGTGGEALAAMTQVGNRSRTQTYAEIADAVGVSEASARDAVKALINRGIAKPIEPHAPSVERRTRKPGRPKDMVRLEFDPTYAWCGPVEDGMSYLDAQHAPIGEFDHAG